MSAIFDRRHQYSRSGLPLAGGGSASERKSHFQVMENARKSGYVNVSRRARPLLRFTDAGEQYLSALAGIECMASSRRLMQQIAALTDAGDTNTGFVLWHDLAGSESPSRLIRTAMPRLVRDQLESHSDGDGMVGFKISELGRDALCSHRKVAAAVCRNRTLQPSIFILTRITPRLMSGKAGRSMRRHSRSHWAAVVGLSELRANEYRQQSQNEIQKSCAAGRRRCSSKRCRCLVA